MASMLTQSVRSRWLAFAVHGGLWLLLAIAILKLGGKAPPYGETTFGSSSTTDPAPVGRLAQLFAATNFAVTRPDTNATSPFFTRQFVPPPTPAPPPPPTTKKIDVVYRGFFVTQDKVQHVMLLVADKLEFIRIGEAIATNAYLQTVTMQSAVITNAAGQTNLLSLNVKSQIEVPLK